MNSFFIIEYISPTNNSNIYTDTETNNLINHF